MPADISLPVDSFRDAAPLLRRPFTAAAVKFKVQSTWPKQNPTGGLVVAYIDARLAVERLNLVCPHLWFDEYSPVQGGLMCRLTVDGLTRHDIGEGVGKGLYSDALKRAAVKFGVGVSLYAIPQSFIGTQDGSAKSKTTSKGPTLVMTDAGERAIRQRYRSWLDATGTKSFGDPLDHGDVEDAQGDAESEHETISETVGAPANAEPDSPIISAERAATLAEIAWTIGCNDRLQLAASHAHGADVGDCSTQEAATASLAGLTEAQALRLDAWLAKKSEEVPA